MSQPDSLSRRLISSGPHRLLSCGGALYLRTLTRASRFFSGLTPAPGALRRRGRLRYDSWLLLVRGRRRRRLCFTSPTPKRHDHRQQSASRCQSSNRAPTTQLRFIVIAAHPSTVSCVRSPTSSGIALRTTADTFLRAPMKQISADSLRLPTK